jgi:hypothetical protein
MTLKHEPDTWRTKNLEGDIVDVVEVDPRLRESLEPIFIHARDIGMFDTWALLPVAQLLKALGWSADSVH